MRRQLLPVVAPRYAGYVVWRAVLRERSIPPAVHSNFHHMSFCFPDGEMMLCLPMAAAEGDDERRFQIAWFRPADQAALLEMCTDATGRRHGTSIPPPLIRGEVLEALRTSADAKLPAEIAALLAQTTQPILQPIFDCVSPRIAFERVVLLGDAAFVARPHVATGVTKAALDARCLVDALSAAGSIDAALAQYETSVSRPAAAWSRAAAISASIWKNRAARCRSSEIPKKSSRVWSGRSSRRLQTHRRPARKRRYVAIVSQMTSIPRSHRNQTASADADVELGARLGASDSPSKRSAIHALARRRRDREPEFGAIRRCGGGPKFSAMSLDDASAD